MDELGKVIRKKRNKLNLSISQLAEKSGLSTGLISQVERGIVVPSIKNVVKIANALDTTIADFFDDGNSVFLVQKPGERNIVYSDDGSKKYEFLAPIHDRKIEFVLITLKGATNEEGELLSHDGEEAGYVLKGSMILNLDGVKHVLTEGDSIYFSSQVPHMYESFDDEECVSIWAMTPPSW